MVERCRSVGFDLARVPVEVSPTAHFHMGGIRIDAECRSNLEGLFAAGEDSSGVHGANRLGGNGVAESIVFGARAGDIIARYLTDRGLPDASGETIQRVAHDAQAPLSRTSGEDAYALRDRLGELTWKQVGLVRDGTALHDAIVQLEEMHARASEIAVNPNRPLNLEWQAALDVQNLIEVADLIARAANTREESRGSHYRSDFPNIDNENWLRNVYLMRNPVGAIQVTTEPVKLSRVQPAQPAPVTPG